MNILIVDDEKCVALAMAKALMASPTINIVETVYDSKTALAKIKSDVFDLILLDVYLKNEESTGLDLCKQVRSFNSEIPIVIVTGHHSIDHLEKAFKYGANDYIKKPFDTKELLLRIHRWIQFSSKIRLNKQISYQNLIYDFHVNEVYFQEEKIPLTRKNKTLLLLFMRNPEELLTKRYIHQKFWGDYYEVSSRNLRSNIQHLRKSLDPCASWIRTIRGEGYMLRK